LYYSACNMKNSFFNSFINFDQFHHNYFISKTSFDDRMHSYDIEINQIEKFIPIILNNFANYIDVLTRINNKYNKFSDNIGKIYNSEKFNMFKEQFINAISDDIGFIDRRFNDYIVKFVLTGIIDIDSFLDEITENLF